MGGVLCAAIGGASENFVQRPYFGHFWALNNVNNINNNKVGQHLNNVMRFFERYANVSVEVNVTQL